MNQRRGGGDAAGEKAELWIIPGARHVEAMFLYPEEYQTQMFTFFGNP